MTEQDAKTKWCPMVRTHIVSNKDYYGIETADGPAVNKCTKRAVCIASACMMWRSIDNVAKNLYPGDTAIMGPPAGYCGLAGKG